MNPFGTDFIMYHSEVEQYERDSERALRSYRRSYRIKHGLPSPESITLWSILLIIGFLINPILTT